MRTGGNLGYGRAANIGVAATTADLVVIANPDVVWSPGALDTLVEAAQRWPEAASFGPLIRTVDGEVYPSARALPSLAPGIGHALFGWFWPGNPWTATYRHGNASTADFVRVAEQVSRQDLRGFFQRWVYGTGRPALP